MINIFVDGIAEALDNEFGYPIYTENVPQGLREPCFAILYVVTIDEPYLVGRRLRKIVFDILYFPTKGDEQNREMYSIESRLYSALEYINVLDILVRGTKMSSEIVDGVLHFSVSYSKFIGETESASPQMETLNLEEN